MNTIVLLSPRHEPAHSPSVHTMGRQMQHRVARRAALHPQQLRPRRAAELDDSAQLARLQRLQRVLEQGAADGGVHVSVRPSREGERSAGAVHISCHRLSSGTHTAAPPSQQSVALSWILMYRSRSQARSSRSILLSDLRPAGPRPFFSARFPLWYAPCPRQPRYRCPLQTANKPRPADRGYRTPLLTTTHSLKRWEFVFR